MSSDRANLPLVSVHSYKGGVGKTTLVALMGLAFREIGMRVCLVDLDLVAPGLSYVLGVPVPKVGILDYLLIDPEKGKRQASAKTVCVSVTPGFSGLRSDAKVHLIAGRPNFDQARGVQSYILAELHGGLLSGSLDRLLAEVQTLFNIQVFVLDSPPSIFGISFGVRRLVEEHAGIEVVVSTPMVQDLLGSSAMLDAIEEARAKQQQPRPIHQVFAMNRYHWENEAEDVSEDVRRLFFEASGGVRQSRSQLELWTRWLNHYEVTRVPELDCIERMARVLRGTETRPAAREVLVPQLLALCRGLQEKMSGCHGSEAS